MIRVGDKLYFNLTDYSNPGELSETLLDNEAYIIYEPAKKNGGQEIKPFILPGATAADNVSDVLIKSELSPDLKRLMVIRTSTYKGLQKTNSIVDALKFTGFFDARSPIVMSRAPGRLDVMGGIADYSGSLVLQRTTSEATFAAVQRTDKTLLNVVSLSPDSNGIPRVFALPLAALLRDGSPIRYAEARMIFANATDHWAAYVVGVFIVLMRERGVVFTQGARMLISSRVPESKGVASSAALEVALGFAQETAGDTAGARRHYHARNPRDEFRRGRSNQPTGPAE